MDPERLRKIDSIINEALDLPAAERSAQVRLLCGDDEKLLDDVMQMLALADEADEAFLEKPLMRWDAGPMTSDEKIGPYTILKLLGEGGMGQVYLARQTVPFERDVALKVIKLGSDRERLLRRFKREQETLARLSHPYIAQVYDAGFSESGNPYFAMEYIDGVPVTDYCRENKLNLPARLELFIQLCDAVQYAHQCGIIHRDIKPANMLVCAKEGVAIPKIIDFGIAKLRGVEELLDPIMENPQPPSEAAVGNSLTQTGLIMGSLGFMSPEQTNLANPDVDTRTDIYSLGVVLYELLTGRRPLDESLRGDMGYDELLRVIREQTLTPPAMRVVQGLAAANTASKSPEQLSHNGYSISPEKLAKTLRGDLDSITMKALARDKDQRYSSAAALADDLRSFMRGDPVAAREHTRHYLMRRWVGRHTIAFGAAIMVVLALLSGSLFAINGLLRAKEANLKSGETLVILKQFLSSADPLKEGKDILLVDLLAGFPQKLNPNTSPDVLADIYEILGDTYASLGDPQGSLNMYENSLTSQEAAQSVPEEIGVMRNIKRAQELSALARFPEAEKIFRSVIEEQSAKRGAKHTLVLDASRSLGYLLGQTDRPAEGVSLLTAALEIRIAKEGDETEGVNEMRSSLGQLYTQLDEHKKAAGLLEQVYTWNVSRNGVLYPDSLRVRLEQAMNAYRQGDTEQGLTITLPLLEDMRKVMGADHPQTLRAAILLGSIYHVRKEFQKAEVVFRETLALVRAKLGSEHAQTLALTNSLIVTYYALGQGEDVINLMRDLTALQTRVLGASAGPTLITKGNLGYVLFDFGYLQEAHQILRETLAAARKVFQGNRKELRGILSNMVLVQIHRELWAEAEPLAVENVALSKAQGPTDPDYLEASKLLARVWTFSGKKKEALLLFDALHPEMEKLLKDDPTHWQEFQSWHAQAR